MYEGEHNMIWNVSPQTYCKYKNLNDIITTFYILDILVYKMTNANTCHLIEMCLYTVCDKINIEPRGLENSCITRGKFFHGLVLGIDSSHGSVSAWTTEYPHSSTAPGKNFSLIFTYLIKEFTTNYVSINLNLRH